MGWEDFATSLTGTLVEDTVNEQFHTMTPGDIANTARMVEAENNPSGVDQEAGYDALRSSLDETIAKLVATKEQVNFAEATGDTMLLKQASADLSLALSNSTGYWEAQVREKHFSTTTPHVGRSAALLPTFTSRAMSFPSRRHARLPFRGRLPFRYIAPRPRRGVILVRQSSSVWCRTLFFCTVALSPSSDPHANLSHADRRRWPR